MKFFYTLFFSVCGLLVFAQDSLRLTVNLEGFKKNDLLEIEIAGQTYLIDTEQKSIKGRSLYLDNVQRAIISLKNKITYVWLENGDIELNISKSQFPKNVSVNGSKSQDLWNEILVVEQDKRVSLLEKNIDHPVVETYMMIAESDLKPRDLSRIRAKMSAGVNDYTKYNLRQLDIKWSEVVKKGDQIFDFIAETSTGKEVDTKTLRGKYLLLDFAGTNCSWCWNTYPDMQESLVNYSSLEILTFNKDFKIASWNRHAKNNEVELPWPVLWKAENKKEIFEKYGVSSYPTYVLVSPEGKVLEYWRAGKDEKINKILAKYQVD